MTANFNWDEFAKADQTAQTPSPSSEFPWDQFEKKPEKPSLLQEAGRHVARSASRIGETLLGLPGDITRSIAHLGQTARKKIEQGTGGKYPFLAPEEQYAELLKKLPPSSAQIREKTKEWLKEFLEPQSKGEAIADTLVSDIASLAIPIKGKIPFARAIGTAVGSNLASEGAYLLGAGEEGQIATKMGAAFLLSAFRPNGAKKYADSLYTSSKKLLPEEARVSAKALSSQSAKLKQQLMKGGTAPYKAPSLTKLNEIQSKITNGRIPVDELTQFKIDINKARSSLYGDVNLDKGGRAMAKRNLDATAKIVDNALSEYGKTNPAWAREYRAANEVYGAIAQSKKVSDFISRAVGQGKLTKGAVVAAEIFLAPKAIPATIAGYGALKTGELLTRIAKSPTLQQYYLGVVQAALKEDAALMSKYLAKLDAGLKKEESESNQ